MKPEAKQPEQSLSDAEIRDTRNHKLYLATRKLIERTNRGTLGPKPRLIIKVLKTGEETETKVRQ